MMQRRRELLASLASLSVLGLPVAARAQDEGADYDDVAKPFPTYRLYGTKPALGAEEKVAREILDGAPNGASFLDTARYFEGITQANADGQLYNAQWSTRWNPVIVGFYQSTSLPKPYVYRKGDTIDWCAAFLNWCLLRSGRQATGSAMSGSFRLGAGLGKPTSHPVAGDIIVFKKADPKEAAVGFGHVAIFLEHAKDGFKVLGGNQKAGKRYSSVNTTYFPETSERLVLDSIRSLASIPLRSAKV